MTKAKDSTATKLLGSKFRFEETTITNLIKHSTWLSIIHLNSGATRETMILRFRKMEKTEDT
ncbi:hypothetical protein GB937_006505 [Aspergillus fischeri]|nr:hypothetical protein GB937_006505 [Aspergillus fischeri]